MAKSGLPPETSLDDVKVRIRKAYTNPNVGQIQQVVLKEGPSAFRVATLLEILDPGTGRAHHYSLKIDSIDRRKAGWFHKPDKSVRLEGADPNEIERLSRFLQAHIEGKLSESPGELHVLRSEDYRKLEVLVEHLPRWPSPDLVELLKRIIPRINDSGAYLRDFAEALENSNPETVRHLAIASRVVEHRRAYDRLVQLVADSKAGEQAFQDLLSQNAWMFGSEYSELLDRRTWTRDDNVDFMLRRTSDNYLEIIEIKTLLSHPMETGYRRTQLGAPIPRDIIRLFVCTYNGTEVFRAELHPAIAANPFIVFSTIAVESGTLEFQWTGDNGFWVTQSAAIVVE